MVGRHRPAAESARSSSSSSAVTGWNRMRSKNRSSHGRSPSSGQRCHIWVVRPMNW
jgi:hypothetical protein